MEKESTVHSSFDITVFFHNLLRILPRLIWFPLILAAILGFWKYRQTMKNYVPRYEAVSIYRVSASRAGSMDITNYGFYMDSNAAIKLASSFPYVISSDQGKNVLQEKTGRRSLPASVSCRAETKLLVFTASGSSADSVYDALLIVEDVFPEVGKNILGSFTLETFEPPEKPTAPVNSVSPFQPTAKYALIGLLIGLGFIALFAYFRKTVHNSEDLRQLLNTPCLGLLPEVRFKARTAQNKAVLLTNPHLSQSYIESVRGVRFQLMKELEQQSAKVIMITSTSPNEGKSTVSANLALSLADQNHRVVLVDCDLRKQTLKDLFGITEPSFGLVDLISKRTEDVEGSLIGVEGSSLKLLSGDRVATQPQNFLASPRLKSVINALRQNHDFVIVDTPPSGLLSDAVTLSEWVDGVIYVVRQDYVSNTAMLDSVQSLHSVDLRFIGTIVNRTSRSTSSSGYGYGYRKGYGYGYGYGYSSKYKNKYYSSKTTQTEEETDSYKK